MKPELSGPDTLRREIEVGRWVLIGPVKFFKRVLDRRITKRVSSVPILWFTYSEGQFCFETSFATLRYPRDGVTLIAEGVDRFLVHLSVALGGETLVISKKNAP